jgi:hypothetical protein
MIACLQQRNAMLRRTQEWRADLVEEARRAQGRILNFGDFQTLGVSTAFNSFDDRTNIRPIEAKTSTSGDLSCSTNPLEASNC